MSERTCKKCGSVEYGIWGNVGLIGWSLFIGACGLMLSVIFPIEPFVIMGVVFGIICLMPMWMISFHEQRELEKKELENA